MDYNINIVLDAEKDIVELYQYVILHDSEDNAEYLLEQIEKTCLSLSSYPNKGHVLPELERIGIFNYKEIHFKPYRIIYQVIDDDVYIHCVLDGRRSLQELLEKRLLR